MDLELDAARLGALDRAPEAAVEGGSPAGPFTARIAIPHYPDRIARHYGLGSADGLKQICARTGIAPPLRHFGLVCTFERPAEIRIHDDRLTLAPGIRALVDRFGPVVLTNARMPADHPRAEQRNIFSNLRFHFDRGANQSGQLSLFTRDPNDPEQAAPRASSTLHAANIVPHLQLAKELGRAPASVEPLSLYEVFLQEPDVTRAFGSVLFEHRWDAPKGTGEIAVLNNRTELHASYYRRPGVRGYPIGVRYLD